jgi:hypothetical protein
MEKIMKRLSCLGIALLASTSVLAEDRHLPIQVGGGLMASSADVFGVEDDRFETELNGGFGSISYHPLKWLGVEYRRTYREDPDFVYESRDGELDLRTNDVSVNFSYQFAPKFYMTAKVGVSNWEAEGHTEDPFYNFSEDLNIRSTNGPWELRDNGERVSFKGDETDPFVGLAFTFAVNKRLELVWQVDHVDSDYLELSTASFGVFTRF